jgi:hypothetical protein
LVAGGIMPTWRCTNACRHCLYNCSPRQAGLHALLVSVSMFHNEFVPFRSMRNAVEQTREVFGPWSVIVYLPHLYDLLARLPGDGKRRLEEFSRLAGVADRLELLPQLYGVIPGGRAVRALRRCYSPRPAQAFAGRRCDILLDTTHFHIDPSGSLFTGLCAGLSPASVEDLHPEITPRTHPIFSTLLAEGPHGLMAMATHDHAYEERPTGYVSPCDLCIDVRRWLRGRGSFPELRPDAFYDDGLGDPGSEALDESRRG